MAVRVLYESDHTVQAGLHALVVVGVKTELAIAFNDLFGLVFHRVEYNHVAIPDGAIVPSTNRYLLAVQRAGNGRVSRTQHLVQVNDLPLALIFKIIGLSACLAEALDCIEGDLLMDVLIFTVAADCVNGITLCAGGEIHTWNLEIRHIFHLVLGD